MIKDEKMHESCYMYETCLKYDAAPWLLSRSFIGKQDQSFGT
jgi:hypothetical protein